MTLWSDGATAMAPIAEMSSLSNNGAQFCPPSTVFQTPPATPPKYQVSGSPGTPSIASARPPRNGPICRHCIPLNNFSSIALAASDFAEAVGEAFGDSVGPPSRGAGLTANVLKQTKIRATEETKRRTDVSIRVSWKASRAVQLESRNLSNQSCGTGATNFSAAKFVRDPERKLPPAASRSYNPTPVRRLGEHFGYSLNLSLQQAVSHGDEREFEIAQRIASGTAPKPKIYSSEVIGFSGIAFQWQKRSAPQMEHWFRARDSRSNRPYFRFRARTDAAIR